jgi:hypothetical protein
MASFEGFYGERLPEVSAQKGQPALERNGPISAAAA